MKETVWVRAAQPNEAADVVTVIREAFTQEVIQRTVYGCSGITAYIKAVLTARELVTPTFLVAGWTSQVAAAAEVGVAEDGVFLSYIGTRSAARSKGLGTRLLLAASELYSSKSDSRMSLDVYQENTRAQDWYRRAGFEVIGERGWWELDLKGRKQAPAVVSGLPQADLCHREFGFSEIILHFGGESHRVGRLGTEWFRVTGLAELDNPAVLAALCSLDPTRKVLALGDPSRTEAARLGAPTMHAFRMQAPIRRLKETLGSI